jgi:hypothetical protein
LLLETSRSRCIAKKEDKMSIQTNFRAEDMLGSAAAAPAPVAAPAKVAPKVTPKAAPIVEVAPVVEDVVEAEAVVETVDAPAAE